MSRTEPKLYLPIWIAVFGSIALQPVKAEERLVSMDVKIGTLAETINNALLSAASADFGGAIIVEQNGKIILKAGYGYANREQRIPFRPGTIAQIGSISKSFTAAAIADLKPRARSTQRLLSRRICRSSPAKPLVL